MNKKFLLTIVALFVGFVLVACGDSGDGATEGADKLEQIKEKGDEQK